MFYHVRDATTAAEFDERWSKFEEKFGTKPRMQTYLRDEIYRKRERWGLPWVDTAYHANMMSTSIGEAFHSLLASGKSANRNLSHFFQLVDASIVRQAEKHNIRCAKKDTELLSLSSNHIPGLVLPSSVKLLSPHAFSILSSLNESASRMRVVPTHTAEVHHLATWEATNLISSNGRGKKLHLPAEQTQNQRSGSETRVLEGVLSRSASLPKVSVCR